MHGFIFHDIRNITVGYNKSLATLCTLHFVRLQLWQNLLFLTRNLVIFFSPKYLVWSWTKPRINLCMLVPKCYYVRLIIHNLLLRLCCSYRPNFNITTNSREDQSSGFSTLLLYYGFYSFTNWNTTSTSVWTCFVRN